MENQVAQIAARIQGLRTLLDITPEEMAQITGVTLDAYNACESGENDFSFTFLLKCAQKFGVDISELVTGETPRLSFYTVVRKGQGMPIHRRAGFSYHHLGALLKDRRAEPFVVTAPWSAEAELGEVALSTHAGQELDYILSGSLKVVLENHVEVLNAGDSVFYNSGHGHGMVAVGGQDCTFLAVVLPEDEKED